MLQVGGTGSICPTGKFGEPHLAFPLSPWCVSLPPSLLRVLQVKATMYLTYLRAVGTPLCLHALFLFFCQQVASFCRGYWLSLWADDPTVDGRQTHAALRGWVFGLLGCLQGTPASLPHSPSSSSTRGFLRAPSPTPPWLTLSFLNICANVLGPSTDLPP